MSAGPLEAENHGMKKTQEVEYFQLDGVSEGRAEQPRRCPGLPKSSGGSLRWRGDRCVLRCEVCGPSALSECSAQLGAPSETPPAPSPEQRVP